MSTESSVEFEPPDTVLVIAGGHVTPEDVQAVTDAIVRIATGKPYILQLVDIRRLESMPPEARAIAEKAGNRYESRGIACFGGKLLIRTVVGFAARTFVMLSGRASQTPIRFFNTEAQARAWLAERRAIVQEEISRGMQKP